MGKSIGILDKDYVLWVKELVKRYRSSQIKAAIKVKKEILRYYWELGKDIEEKQAADNKVDQVLLDLSGKVDDEDNPIFMIAHLK